jgi:hypothetical protein
MFLLVQVTVRLVVVAILVACAAVVTKLMATNLSYARHIIWKGPLLREQISAAMPAFPVPSVSNSTTLSSTALQELQRAAGGLGFGFAPEETGAMAGWDWDSNTSQLAAQYCAAKLSGFCSRGFTR